MRIVFSLWLLILMLGLQAGGLPLLNLEEVKRIPGSSGDLHITDLQHSAAAANHLYVVVREGRILFCDLEGTNDRLVLDLVNKVETGGEAGLLGMVFAPGSSDRFYVFYMKRQVADETRVVRVSRFTIDAEGTVDSAEEEVILELPIENFYHHGGQLRFGADGYLYISSGDHGRANHISQNAQNLNNLYGKILRIDPEGAPEGTPYLIPAQNPFSDGVDGAPEIIAWGLRNPYRFCFESTTGDLIIGDVGEDDWEELNRLTVAQMTTGANFGWPHREGLVATDLPAPPGSVFQDPFYAYSDGTSVIGGLFPQSGGFEAGTYLFADLNNGVFARNAEGETAKGPARSLITSFGESSNGEVFCGAYGGVIRKLSRVESIGEVGIFPESGTYPGSVSIGLALPTENVMVRYTTDGTDPSEQSPIVPLFFFRISEPSELRVRGFFQGYEPGPVSSATYDLQCQKPESYTPSEDWNPLKVFTLTSSTPEAVIRYSIDGSEVTESSPLYDPGVGVTAPVGAVVRAQAFKNGWVPSEMSQVTVTGKVAPVSFAPANYNSNEPFRPGKPFFLSTLTEDAVIRYAINENPDETSPIFDGQPLVVPFGDRLVMMATYPGMETSFFSNVEPVYESVGKGVLTQVTPAEVLPSAINVTQSPDGDYIVYGHSRDTLLIRDGVQTSLGLTGVTKVEWSGDSFIGLRFSNLYLFEPPNFNAPTKIYEGSISGFCINPSGEIIIGRSSSPASIYVWNGVTERILRTGFGTFDDFTAYRNDYVRVTSENFPQAQIADMTVPSKSLTNQNLGYSVRALAKDTIGNLYVKGEGNLARLYKIAPTGEVVTLGVGSEDGGISWLTSRGRVFVDANGVVHVTDGSAIWQFTQDDWDNDGIPDAMESEISGLLAVGIDDRLVDDDSNGLSNAFEALGGTIDGGFIRELSGDGETMVVGFPVPAGKECQLEFSDDLGMWHSHGEPFVPVLNDTVQIVYRFDKLRMRAFRVRWAEEPEAP